MGGMTSSKRAYVAAVALVVDAEDAESAYRKVAQALGSDEQVLDYRLLRVERLDQDSDGRITDGSYVDGEFMSAEATLSEEESVKVGARVVWNDPDRGLSTGVYTVAAAGDRAAQPTPDERVVELVNDVGGHAQALLHEIVT